MNQSVHWKPPPRPAWLQSFNEEAAGMDLHHLVPLDTEELIKTAKRMSGFDDFGSDEWRAPFEKLVNSINSEAELHFFGRLMTRSDILIWLQALLGIQAAFKENPEIAEERIDRPVFISGLSRSGTSILFELLSQDSQFGSPKHWEMMFPYPPPEKDTYETDPRIDRCQRLVTQFYRVAPTYQTMHEMDARLPNECIIGQACTFISEYIPFLFQVPSYIGYLYQQGNWEYSYTVYKKMLQLLQFKNPRKHWLLKAPSHLNFLPVLFKVFPDAQVLITHRDPIYAQASVTNLAGTFYWMRSNKPLDVKAFESLLSPPMMAAQLERIIDWLESGTIPSEQISHSLYADLISDPFAALNKIYSQIGISLDHGTRNAMQDYLDKKPKEKFGKHEYDVGSEAEVIEKREYFKKYQTYFGVPDE